MPLTNDEFSYALGAGGSTRKKLARAADCIMEVTTTHGRAAPHPLLSLR